MVTAFFDAGSLGASDANNGRHAGQLDGLDATIVLNDGHSATASMEASVTSIGHDGIVLSAETGLAGARHAWIEVTLPGEGTIRPLVQFDGAGDGRAWGHIAHLFPADADRLMRFEAAG